MTTREHVTTGERYAFWLMWYSANGWQRHASAAALAILCEDRPALLPYGRA